MRVPVAMTDIPADLRQRQAAYRSVKEAATDGDSTG